MTFAQAAGKLRFYLKRDGPAGVAAKMARKLKTRWFSGYARWERAHRADAETLRRQAETRFETPMLLSVVVPVYNTKPAFLNALAASLRAQSYGQWEACLYDGGSTDAATREALSAIAASDGRFHVVFGECNEGISGNTNRTLAMAKGAYCFFCDHDDLLTPDALFCFRERIDRTDADLLYSDEDKTDVSGKHFFEPHLKPDFSPDLLRQSNYICHLTAVRRSLMDEIGGLNRQYDGAQDFELVLRASEKARRIEHIPRVLYRWRMLGRSMSHQESERCLLAGKRAVEAHLARCGLAATVSTRAPYLCVDYRLPADARATLVWVDREGGGSLNALRALLRDAADVRLCGLVACMRRPPEACELPTVCAAPGEGLATLLNRAVEQVETPLVILLDSTLRPMDSSWARRLAMYAQRADIGCVTSLLYDRKKRVVCAGYAVGETRVARGLFHGLRRGDDGYFQRAAVARNVSAVPWCWCAFRREAWIRAGGADPAFQKQLFDVDLCLKMQGNALYHVCVPRAGAAWTGGTRPWFVPGDAADDAALLVSRHRPLRDPFYNPQWDGTQANDTLK